MIKRILKGGRGHFLRFKAPQLTPLTPRFNQNLLLIREFSDWSKFAEPNFERNLLEDWTIAGKYESHPITTANLRQNLKTVRSRKVNANSLIPILRKILNEMEQGTQSSESYENAERNFRFLMQILTRFFNSRSNWTQNRDESQLAALSTKLCLLIMKENYHLLNRDYTRLINKAIPLILSSPDKEDRVPFAIFCYYLEHSLTADHKLIVAFCKHLRPRLSSLDDVEIRHLTRILKQRLRRANMGKNALLTTDKRNDRREINSFIEQLTFECLSREFICSKLKNLQTIIFILNKEHIRVGKEILIKLKEVFMACDEDFDSLRDYIDSVHTIAILENRYTGKKHYMEELDIVYERACNVFIENFKQDFYTLASLSQLAVCLQRANVFNESLVLMIAERFTLIEIKMISNPQVGFLSEYTKLKQKTEDQYEDLNILKAELFQCSKSDKSRRKLLQKKVDNSRKEIKKTKKEARKQKIVLYQELSSIVQYSRILHYLSRNYSVLRDEGGEILERLEMLNRLYFTSLELSCRQSEYGVQFNQDSLLKMLWSSCVLFPVESLKEEAAIIFKLLEQIPYKNQMDQISLNILNSILCYLRKVYTPPSGFSLLVNQYMKSVRAKRVQNVSLVTLRVVKALERLNVPYTLEEGVENLELDLVIKSRDGDPKKDLLVDIHGYQHFFRNAEVYEGNAIFKRKILKECGYTYIEIKVMTLDTLLEDHELDKYLKDLLGLEEGGQWSLPMDEDSDDLGDQVAEEPKNDGINSEDPDSEEEFDSHSEFEVSIDYCGA